MKGLDVQCLLTREEVLDVCSRCETDIPLMDSPTPFIPETSYYKVARVHEGTYVVLIYHMVRYYCYLIEWSVATLHVQLNLAVWKI